MATFEQAEREYLEPPEDCECEDCKEKDEDVICSYCGEHTEYCSNCGTECCGAHKVDSEYEDSER